MKNTPCSLFFGILETGMRINREKKILTSKVLILYTVTKIIES